MPNDDILNPLTPTAVAVEPTPDTTADATVDGFLPDDQAITPDVPVSPTPTTTPVATDNHEAFASLNKKYREQLRENQTLKAQIAAMNATAPDTTDVAPTNPTANATPKPPTDATQQSLEKVVGYIEETRQQAELQKTRFDVVQTLAEIYQWDSNQATFYGNNKTVVREITAYQKQGFTPQDIAFVLRGKYNNSFAGMPKPNRTPGANVNPLSAKAENPVRQASRPQDWLNNPNANRGFSSTTGLRSPLANADTITEATYLANKAKANQTGK